MVCLAVIKAVRACNLRCSYCYYINESTPNYGSMISEETLRAFYRSVADHLSDDDCFEFVWHGGEPLLLGKKRFRRYIALQKEYLRPSQIINVIQTNATLIDDGWCDLLQELDVGVGVSLDGPQDVHDRRRPSVRGRSSYHNTLRGIELMQNRGNTVGALCVADPAASGRRVLSHFCELGLPDCDLLIPITNNSLERLAGARTDHADADGLRRYYLDAFDEWITNRKEVISVRLFDSLIQNAFGIPHGDLNAGSRNIAENIILETDGTACLDPDFWYVDRFALGEVYSLNCNVKDPGFSLDNVNADLENLAERYRLRRIPSDCQQCAM